MPDHADTPETSSSKSRTEFFRHSGWMMFAGILGGVFALGVHFLAKKMPLEDYGLFVALMAVTMLVPGAPLQMAFTQQAALAKAAGREQELAGLLRVIFGACLVIWLIFTVVVLLFQKEILFRWEVTDPVPLWIMLPFMLVTILMPMFVGLLQGRQNFFWLGWASLVSMSIRLGVAVISVLVLGAGVRGIMAGVLIGGLISLLIAMWQTHDLWRLPPKPSNWRAVVRQAFPLIIGFGAFQFLLSADTMFAKSYFGKEEVSFYASAGTLSRALMWVVGPLAVVMFPKLVHSHARSEKTDLVGTVFLGTAVLATVGAAGLVVVGPYIVKFVFDDRFVRATSTLLPWYAFGMVPLTLANVLLNTLMARAQHGIVWVLPFNAGLYALAMTQFHASMVQLLQAFGAANLALLATCAWFTLRSKPATPVAV
jgi:O-antigen/teichoic acid export membrane protein